MPNEDKVHKLFVFSLGDKARLKLTQEQGEIIARSQHLNAENMYRLRYVCADGRMVEDWWTESALVAVN